MAKARDALIAGATGLIGRELLSLLLADPIYAKVIVIGRRAPEMPHPKLVVVMVDFDSLPDGKHFPHVDDVFCCLGTTIRKAGSQDVFRKVDYTYVVELAKRAKTAGAKRFMVISAIGANLHSKMFYSRTKGEMERAVSSAGFNGVVIFRPSFLLGDREETRLAEKIGIAAFRLLSPGLIGGLRKYRAVNAKTVARAMLQSAHKTETGVIVLESDEIEHVGSA